jgi:hypothetical protein
MRLLALAFAVTSLALVGCGPHVVGGTDSGGPPDSGSSDAGNPYPAGPYGVTVNKVIQNFAFPGFLTTGTGVKVDTLMLDNTVDLQTLRTLTNSQGNPYRFLLLSLSAGWCPPCNQEAQDLGINGSDTSDNGLSSSQLVQNWGLRGGLYVTVREEGYNESTGIAAVQTDINTWVDAHNTQSSTGYDPGKSIEAYGITQSAFPANLVINLQTMEIVSAWYGLDPTYQKWEAALGP